MVTWAERRVKKGGNMARERGADIAIIGGTGVGMFPLGGEVVEAALTTPWGDTTARIGALHGRRVAFLARHGRGHRLPPHRIAYRANIAGLAMLGVRAVLATTAVGALRT